MQELANSLVLDTKKADDPCEQGEETTHGQGNKKLWEEAEAQGGGPQEG